MGSILIAMHGANDSKVIANIVRGSGMSLSINICETGAEVLRVANDRDYGVVVCEQNLRDTNYTEIADMLPNNFGMVVLTKDPSIEIMRDDMVKLISPFRRGDLLDTIDMVMQPFYRRMRRKKTPPPPKRNADDQKLVAKAKHMLMERNGLTEEEAYRYIQKNSMDLGRKMVESAQMILTLYSDA